MTQDATVPWSIWLACSIEGRGAAKGGRDTGSRRRPRWEGPPPLKIPLYRGMASVRIEYWVTDRREVKVLSIFLVKSWFSAYKLINSPPPTHWNIFEPALHEQLSAEMLILASDTDEIGTWWRRCMITFSTPPVASTQRKSLFVRTKFQMDDVELITLICDQSP